MNPPTTRRCIPASSAVIASGVLLFATMAHAAPDAEALRQTRAGAQAYEQGALEEAVEAFEAARTRAPDDPAARKNLALGLKRQARVALKARDGETALRLLDRALEMHPRRLQYEVLRAQALLVAGRSGEALRQAQETVGRSPAYARAWITLADIEERTGNLEDALTALEQVRRLRPKDAQVQKRLAVIGTRAKAEAGFITHGSGHFAVKYDPEVDAGLVELALTILEDAYSRVTADLGLAPRTRASVVLYDGAEFQRVTGAHSWVGALYQNGVLRVPIRNLKRHRATAERVLTHEFTHHVLRERTPSLPIWWHEGIAQYVEDPPDVGRRRRADLGSTLAGQKKTSRLITFAEMQALRITSVRNTGTVTLYYAQALSFVGWLVDRHGAGALPSFLTALGAGTDVDQAARAAFGDGQSALWTAWSESLRP